MLSSWLPKSLALRAVTLSTLWAAISLFVASTLISSLFRQESEASIQRLLGVHLITLVGSIDLDQNGKISGIPDFGDSPFMRPNSGWYWTAERAKNTDNDRLQSRSMNGQTIPVADPALYPFSRMGAFQRTYKRLGLNGETIQVVENETVSTKFPDIALRFRVMGNWDEYEDGIRDFVKQLYLYLSLFGLGTILINAIAILIGLNPLRAAGASLKQIREGKAQRLEGEFPTEVAPLAVEINALIDNNRRIVERARTQVGNLAHSLKTPLAVMSNEGQALGGAKGAVIGEQTSAMQEQIQHYLQRARIAALKGSVVFRAPVTPVLSQMQRVMQKLNPEKTVEFTAPDAELVFAGEGEDLKELVGNLVENAAKWSRSRVEIKAGKTPGASPPLLWISVSDDGPGLTQEQIKSGIKRGKRMDESNQGWGLGLAMVSDTVREYGGTITLAKAEMGGLGVTITLPLAQ
jgi:signal transduction histidine kinase